MNEPQQSEKASDIVGITEAAQRLGVSERTIYRMLRAGKLRRVSMSDKKGRYVGLELSNEVKSVVNPASDVSDVSDKTTDTRQKRTRDALEEKDAQIAKLLEQQRELQQNVTRLQEQMFELARLVLSQNTATQATPTTPVAAAPAETRSGLFARFRRERDNKR